MMAALPAFVLCRPPARQPEDAPVSDTSGQFKKAPRRKKEPGRSVPVSADVRKAYEDEIKARTERETYLRALGNRDTK